MILQLRFITSDFFLVKNKKLLIHITIATYPIAFTLMGVYNTTLDYRFLLMRFKERSRIMNPLL